MEGVDDAAFLAASEPRAAILAALYRDGPVARDDLVRATDAARVTVGRNLEQLRDHGVVREDGADYRLTVGGRLLVGEFLSLLEVATAADELAPLLEHLPPGEFDLDPRELVGAEVTASTRANPYAPVDRHARTLEDAGEIRVLLPAVGSGPLDATVDRIVSGALSAEFVVSDDVAETLRSTAFVDRVERMLASGNLSIHVHGGEVPYYLGLVDDTVQVGVDEDGIPRALAETAAPAVREWAEETYGRYRASTVPWD